MPGASQPELRTLVDGRLGSGTPATWYVAAFLTMPAADGTGGVEPAIGTYSRVSSTNNGTNWPASATVSGKTTKANGTLITYPNPTADWGLIIGWGLFTVSPINTGTCAYSNLLDGSITVKSGLTPVQFDIGQLIVEFASAS